MKPFTAALITGGRSSRMGADKAFLDWHGRPLWEVQLAKLRAAGAAEILVCGRREQAFAGDGFRLIPDRKEDLGPLSGLANALRAATHDTVLVLAVDMPFITVELLRELIEQRLGSILDGMGDRAPLPHPGPLPLGEGAPPAALVPERMHQASDQSGAKAFTTDRRPFTLSQRERAGVREKGREFERLVVGLGVVPIRTGRFEALAAVFPKAALALAESRLAGTDRSLQGFCREAESAGLVRRWVVPPEHESLFRSVNSPEDLEPRIR